MPATKLATNDEGQNPATLVANCWECQENGDTRLNAFCQEIQCARGFQDRCLQPLGDPSNFDFPTHSQKTEQAQIRNWRPIAAPAFSFQQSIGRLHRSGVAAFDHVAVNVQRDRCLSVTETAADCENVDARVNELRRVGVPEAMEARSGQARAATRAIPCSRHVVRRERFVFNAAEYH